MSVATVTRCFQRALSLGAPARTLCAAAARSARGRVRGKFWTADEDARLAAAVATADAGPKDAAQDGSGLWTRVAAAVGGARTPRGCRQRWASRGGSRAAARRFSEEEDRTLRAVLAERPGDYAHAARALGGDRTPDRVRERWVHRLDPGILWTRFSEREDRVLLRCVEERGRDWVYAVQQLPGRTTVQCQNRWLALEPGIKTGQWSKEEDALLVEIFARLVGERGRENVTYGDVAREMKTRNRKQCRHRLLILEKNAGEKQGSKMTPTVTSIQGG